MYNSRYRVIQKIAKDFIPELDKSGFGISTLYEKYFEYVQDGHLRSIVVLDEVDMVRDLDELMYTLTRMNDELPGGSVSIIGITNKLSFKDDLGQRSKSSLCETEMMYSSYTPSQLSAILSDRAKKGFKPGVVDEGAINLSAAIVTQDTGDVRYALKLLLRAGEIADEKKLPRITDKEVELARRSVDADLATEAIATLPAHQQLVLLSVCNLTIEGGKYQKLGKQSMMSPWSGEEAQAANAKAAPHAPPNNEDNEPYLLSGEVYEEYTRLCRHYKKQKRSARWYREYLNDLEMFGLIVTVESGRGIRGHTRLIKVGYSATQMKSSIEKSFSIVEGKDDDEAIASKLTGMHMRGKEEGG